MISYITAPFKWFFKLEAASGLLLLIFAIIALILSNSNLSNYYFDTLNSYIFLGYANFGLKLLIKKMKQSLELKNYIEVPKNKKMLLLV